MPGQGGPVRPGRRAPREGGRGGLVAGPDGKSRCSDTRADGLEENPLDSRDLLLDLASLDHRSMSRHDDAWGSSAEPARAPEASSASPNARLTIETSSVASGAEISKVLAPGNGDLATKADRVCALARANREAGERDSANRSVAIALSEVLGGEATVAESAGSVALAPRSRPDAGVGETPDGAPSDAHANPV